MLSRYFWAASKSRKDFLLYFLRPPVSPAAADTALCNLTWNQAPPLFLMMALMYIIGAGTGTGAGAGAVTGTVTGTGTGVLSTVMRLLIRACVNVVLPFFH